MARKGRGPKKLGGLHAPVQSLLAERATAGVGTLRAYFPFLVALYFPNRVEYAVFAVVYFLTEVPLLLGAVAVYRTWWLPAVHRIETSGNAR